MIDEARVIADIQRDLPTWSLALGALGPFLVAAGWGSASTLVVGSLISRKFRALDASEHWTERARHWEPIVTTFRTITVFSLMIGAALGWLVAGPFSLLPVEPSVLLGVLGGWLGAFAGQLIFFPRVTTVTWRDMLRRSLIYRVCFGMSIPFVILSMFCISTQMTPFRWGAMGIFSALYLFASLWPPLKLANKLGALRVAGAREQQILASISERLNHKPRGLWLFDVGFANAFALYFSNNIVMTDQLLECVDEHELDTILIHEMAHLTDGVSNKLGAASGLVVLALMPFLIATAINELWAGGLILGLMVALLIFNRRSARQMEDHADATSSEHQFDEGVYARALEKIYAYNLFAAVRHKRRAHAHLYDRMLAAGVTPDYPRPEPPPKHNLLNGGYSFLTWMLLCFFVVCGVFAEDGWNISNHARVAAGILGGSPKIAERISYNYAEQGDTKPALLYAEGMVIADDASLLSLLHLASRECEAGLKEEANKTYERALKVSKQPENIGAMEDPERFESAYRHYLDAVLPECEVAPQ